MSLNCLRTVVMSVRNSPIFMNGPEWVLLNWDGEGMSPTDTNAERSGNDTRIDSLKNRKDKEHWCE